MGWLYKTNSTKESLIAERLSTSKFLIGKSLTPEYAKGESIAHSIRGNVLWQVRQITYPNGTIARYISCDLLSKQDNSWGYKDMDESVHPYYYNCPLKFLDMAPEVSADWRKGVREYHNRLKRKIEVGKRYELINRAIPYVDIILIPKPILGTYNGKTYRVTRTMIGEQIPV